MTIQKIGYILSKKLDEIYNLVTNLEFESYIVEKYDSGDGREIWIELENKKILDLLYNEGYISESEIKEILDKDVETLLFFR